MPHDSSFEDGQSSTCEPGAHRWVEMKLTPGEVVGVDSHGEPVFVPSMIDEPATVIGCNDCNEPWSSAAMQRSS
jgi:hypothetical protein